jgi:ATP-dependent DNA helicase RecQ
VLLFSAGDVVKQTMFIDEKPDPKEQKIAREQLQKMVHYAESSNCRRAELLAYFGEEFEHDNCGGCDNCLAPRATFDGTIAAQKLLSCVYRIRQKSPFGVGLNHVVEVLTGADTEKIRRWGHQELSTYGIGAEHSRPEWQAIGRELVRLGLLRQTSERLSVLELTDEGRAALRDRRKIVLTRPITAPEPQEKKPRVGDIGCDEALFDKLRDLRKKLADQQNVPAYIVFSDVSLRQMARYYPRNADEFLRISGVGEKKLTEFGSIFLAEIAGFLQQNPRQMFADDSFAAPAAPSPLPFNESARETFQYFSAGETVEQIAQRRALAIGTVYAHLTAAIEADEWVAMERFFSAEEQKEVATAFGKAGVASLAPVREALGNRFDYGRLRVFRAALGAGLIDRSA